ncbi:MAG: cellulase family glycosylhydrolase [Cyclobacteriaceae bacterium]
MRNAIKIIGLLIFPFLLLGCEKDHEVNALSVSKERIDIPADGGTASFTLETNASSWTISNPASDWITLPVSEGTQRSAEITLMVDSKSLTTRRDTLTITAGSAKPVYVVVSQASSQYIYTLTSDKTEIAFEKSGNETTVQITTDAPSWSLQTDADWVEVSNTSGEKGTSTITITALENPNVNRTGKLTLTAESAPTIEIAISQVGNRYPSYNIDPIAADASGMSSTATELAAKIKVGWNIGNTLEAIGGETAWGNPLVTDNLIKAVKQSGFNAIRIPASWNQHMENAQTAKIKESWLARVKQVVQYCVDNEMIAILNIHWDGGWLENNVTTEKQDEVNDKQKAFWEQIATYLRDFDEHLIFASANEPHVENAAQMAVLNSYHQTFVDAVRSTGGRNSHRVLVVQGPSTDVEKTNNLMNTLPTDEIANKMMAEVHYYTPYQFCLMNEDAEWGKMAYFWGEDFRSTEHPDRNATWGEEEELLLLMDLMKTQFVDQGIPVILGEYGAIRRSTLDGAPLTGDELLLHLDSRAYFLKYLTKHARARGLIPFYWDAGFRGDNTFTLFDRRNNTEYDQQALDAVMEGAEQGYSLFND